MDRIYFSSATAPSQFKDIEALAFPIWREHYEPIIGTAQVEYMLQKFQTTKAVEEQVRAGALYFLVQIQGGENIGFLSVLPRPRELFLSKLYLLKTYRGKGYARQALEFIQGLAKEKGLQRITLTVNKQNPAVKAYQSLGFLIQEPIVTDIGGGFVMDDFRMGLDLY